MNNNTLHPDFPFLAHGYYVDNDDIVFIRLDSEVVVRERAADVLQIIRHCNGRTPFEQIKQRAGLDDQEFADLVDTLCAHEILEDSREVSKTFHRQSRFPLLIPGTIDPADREEAPATDSLPDVPASNLVTLAAERKSVRTFGDEVISKQQLSGLLAAMYGVSGDTRPIPSAGGYYGLKLVVCVLRPLAGLKTGIYRFLPLQQGLKLENDLLLAEACNVIFNLDDEVDNISVIVCVVGNHAESNRKYPNRSYRFQLIEAGHVIQNAHLYAAESGFGVVQRGGFIDSALAAMLSLEFPDEYVISTIAAGTLPSMPGQVSASASSRFTEAAGPFIEQMNYGTYHIDDYLMPRFIAFCRFRALGDSAQGDAVVSSTGVGKSTVDAMVKAVAESIERLACSGIAIDRVASRQEISEPIIDLTEHAPFSESYLKSRNLISFQESEKREWVAGNYMATHESFFTPVDQVCYPFASLNLDRRSSYLASSNGVAAHTNEQEATERAIYELLERDAICAHWYGGVTPSRIPIDHFNHAISDRINAFQRRSNAKVHILNLKTDSLPVVVIIIQADQGGIVSGAACHPEWETACVKALDEAEPQFHLKRMKQVEKIAPEEVISVEDHGTYWWNPDNVPRLGWFLEGPESHPEQASQPSIYQIAAQFEIGVIKLSLPAIFQSLNVVRCVSKHLIPITFGYQAVPVGHPRFEVLGFSQNAPDTLPHFLE